MYCTNSIYPPTTIVPVAPTYPILLQACAADGINEDCYLYEDGTILTIDEADQVALEAYLDTQFE